MKWGVRYQISGVHECPFGKKQAEMIWNMAVLNGVEAEIVLNIDGVWRGVGT